MAAGRSSLYFGRPCFLFEETSIFDFNDIGTCARFDYTWQCQVGGTCYVFNWLAMLLSLVLLYVKDPCQQLACQNGGSCVLENEIARCVCPADLTGPQCIQGQWILNCYTLLEL